jgi:hypothetical protein
MTFIVRIFVDEKGGVSGVVERVRTGRKEQIRSVEDIGRLIAVIVAREKAEGANPRSGGNP